MPFLPESQLQDCKPSNPAIPVQTARFAFAGRSPALTPLLGGSTVALALALALAVAFLGLLAAGPAIAQTPAELYGEGCASCHGSVGQGLAPDSYLLDSFPRPPADLTVPLFNSREPSADWFLVIKYGGARVGLSSQMPSYSGVYSDVQIEALVEYLKSMADSRRYPPGDLNFARPVRTIKPFPEDELLFISRFGEGPGEGTRNTLYFGHRLGTSFQGEVKASRLTGVAGADAEKEVELGLKWAFLHDLERSLLLGAGIEAEIPLESEDSSVIVPYFALAKGLGESYSVQANLRLHLPTQDTGTGDVELSVAGHRMSAWPRGVSPGFELVYRSKPFDDPLGFGTEKWSAIPQALIGLSKGGHVALGLGVELPITGLDYDYRGHVFLLWDFADGAFWSRW